MKRDWSLLRTLLAHFESETIEKFFNGNCGEWLEGQFISDRLKAQEKEEKTRAVIIEHIRQLLERNLVEGVGIESYCGDEDVICFTHPRLTSDGHDVLEAMRSESVWTKVKEIAEKTGIGITITTIKELIPIAIKSILER